MAATAMDASLAPAGAQGWWIVQCGCCSLVRLDPMPQEADLGNLYDAGYFTTGTFVGAPHAGGMAGHLSLYCSPSRRRASLRWNGRRLAHLVQAWQGEDRSRPPGRLLDVGCGAGYFLDAGREAGWEVQGVELSPAAVQVGREQLGLDIFQGTLEQAALQDQAFDILTMFEVLEHLQDPGPVLREAWRVLRPDGLLAVQVPNDLDSYRNRVFGPGNRWWIIPPLHLYYFTASSLTQWLQKSGFTPLYVSSRGSLGTDALTLLRAHGGHPGRLGASILRRLTSPIDQILISRGRHTELLVYARKDPS